MLKAGALCLEVPLQGSGAEHHLLGDLFDGDVAAWEPGAQELLQVGRKVLQAELHELIEVSSGQLLEAFITRVEPGRQ
ncbi:hypothetical protein D9M71_742170 [compost metagenome]